MYCGYMTYLQDNGHVYLTIPHLIILTHRHPRLLLTYQLHHHHQSHSSYVNRHLDSLINLSTIMSKKWVISQLSGCCLYEDVCCRLIVFAVSDLHKVLWLIQVTLLEMDFSPLGPLKLLVIFWNWQANVEMEVFQYQSPIIEIQYNIIHNTTQ